MSLRHEDAGVSALVADARAVAIAELHGLAATRTTLEVFAARVRQLILAQAEAGSWSAYGIRRAEQLAALKVAAVINRSLVGGAKIMLQFDFSATAAPSIVVEST